jgi:hypothetical protein
MITINCLSEIFNNPKDNNLTDVILDVDVSDEYYKLKGLNEEEYPKDAWTIWVTQNGCDRIEKNIWISLCNEGSAEDEWVDGEEKEKILNYIKDNGIVEKASFVF